MNDDATGKQSMSAPPPLMNPHTDISITQNRLPHWQQDNATYFVTFRLADALPAAQVAQWRDEREAWLRAHSQPWDAATELEYVRHFENMTEHCLDEGRGSCLLRSGEPQRIVADALAFFDGQRYRQHAWVVMPNHVHTLLSLLAGHKMEDVVQSWKGFSTHAINRALNRSGSIWQKDYFDRLIRNAEHFWNCVGYIQRNPSKAQLKPGEFRHFESEYVRLARG